MADPAPTPAGLQPIIDEWAARAEALLLTSASIHKLPAAERTIIKARLEPDMNRLIFGIDAMTLNG